MSILRPTFCFSLVAALLLVTAHRLPAPISEIPESPTPAPEQSAKPKPKRTTNPKSQASESTTKSAKPQSTPKQSRFAGTWTGTMPAFPTGPQATVLTIDPKEATMQQIWTGHPPSLVAKAEINGNTIRATFQNGMVTFTYSLSPEPDGATAQVRLQAFMNDNTAVFHRVAESNTAKPAR
jgi:cytoskeletal protein RodZ